MQSQTIKKPVSLIVTCIAALLTTAFFIKLYLGFPWQSAYSKTYATTWSAIMVSLNLLVAAGIVVMFFLRKFGIWLYIAAKVCLFAVPTIAGQIDSVVGLLMPILLIETAIFMALFANHVKYMR